VNLRDVYAAIAFVEETFDVDELRIGDLDLWLFLRDVFVVPFSDHRVLAYQRLTGSSSHVDPLTATPDVPTRASAPPRLGRVGDAVAVMLEPGAPDLDQRAPDIVQFHEYRDYSDVSDDGVVNRIADAFAETAVGRPTTKVIEATADSMRARFAAPPIQFLPALVPAFGRPVPGEDTLLDRLATITEAALRAGFAVDSRREYSRMRLRQLYWRADTYGRLLDVLEARAVQVSSFSNLQRMAAVVAARRRGLPAIDVEHGYMGRLSAYGSLGYIQQLSEPAVTIPSHFWCWGEESVRQLERSLGSATEQHRPLVGGSPTHLQASGTAETSPLPETLRRPVASADRVVLFCWQPDQLVHEDPPRLVPTIIEELACRADPGTLLLFRLHPRSRHLVPLVTRHLRRAGARNVEVEAATLARLPSLLEHTDVLLTSYSTVAFEANALGVPVVLVDEVGADMMRDEVDRGVFNATTSADELIELCASLTPSGVAAVPYLDTDPERPQRALAEVLGPR
jgi:hypothetical protein